MEDDKLKRFPEIRTLAEHVKFRSECIATWTGEGRSVNWRAEFMCVIEDALEMSREESVAFAKLIGLKLAHRPGSSSWVDQTTPDTTIPQ